MSKYGIIILLVILEGCGFKGPLYLPPAKINNNKQSQNTPKVESGINVTNESSESNIKFNLSESNANNVKG